MQPEKKERKKPVKRRIKSIRRAGAKVPKVHKHLLEPKVVEEKKEKPYLENLDRMPAYAKEARQDVCSTPRNMDSQIDDFNINLPPCVDFSKMDVNQLAQFAARHLNHQIQPDAPLSKIRETVQFLSHYRGMEVPRVGYPRTGAK